ncbi:PREDICTED: carbonic anhydrase [Nicrophorus vespilloides]|uniref:Carbonic anhydrase n=1 Tax=Nicrophorus vespilloides TaxID=110193 RepID=A0ABM1M962_NICVS|nr:PREDICTED: carbonic anhydrase [Nicrophorus vespilloides]
MSHWGYGSENGPETWSKAFPAASGVRQSPIDICPVNLQTEQVKPLTWKYIPENEKTLANNGHSWVVNVDGQGSELSGGPLEGKYMLEQFHCHWGASDEEGSEHTVQGKKYSGELHLVHWNTKYSSFAEAAKHPDGLCVLGVFIKPGKPNNDIAKIVSKFNLIQHKSCNAKISTPMDPSNFLPKDSGYWTYMGSLTTPPCSECVIWIVFQEPIEVSHEQLKAFRTLKTYCSEDVCPCDEYQGYLKNNYRPTVPLGERVIRECRQ